QDGKRVQELTFDDAAATNAAVAFHADAPVLGLGEGAQQFDRRGALYPMEPSWGGWNRPVLGSVVPSPFLIGTDGWALFAHRPEGTSLRRVGLFGHGLLYQRLEHRPRLARVQSQRVRAGKHQVAP